MASTKSFLPFFAGIALLAALYSQDNNASGHDDGPLFDVWQSAVSFAPTETVDIIVESDLSTESADLDHSTRFFSVTDANGDILGRIELEPAPAGDRTTDRGRHRGFGFVAMEVKAPRGILIINDAPFERLEPNPRTGRYILGLSLSVSQPPVVPNARLHGLTIAIVSADGSTRSERKQSLYFPEEMLQEIQQE